MILKEYNLIKISTFIYLFSFISLYYLDSNYTPNLIQINKLDKSYYNKVISINAKILKQNLKNQTLFLVLSSLNKTNNSKINGIIFKTKINLNKKTKYKFIGRIGLYKNKIELLITKISII